LAEGKGVGFAAVCGGDAREASGTAAGECAGTGQSLGSFVLFDYQLGGWFIVFGQKRQLYEEDYVRWDGDKRRQDFIDEVTDTVCPEQKS
jgi:hypothetical protein